VRITAGLAGTALLSTCSGATPAHEDAQAHRAAGRQGAKQLRDSARRARRTGINGGLMLLRYAPLDPVIRALLGTGATGRGAGETIWAAQLRRGRQSPDRPFGVVDTLRALNSIAVRAADRGPRDRGPNALDRL